MSIGLNNLSLDYKGSEKLQGVVLDLYGRVLKNLLVSGPTIINLSDLPKGTYFVKIVSTKYNIQVVDKIVKQ